jgi:hypothetical protein
MIIDTISLFSSSLLYVIVHSRAIPLTWTKQRRCARFCLRSHCCCLCGHSHDVYDPINGEAVPDSALVKDQVEQTPIRTTKWVCGSWGLWRSGTLPSQSAQESSTPLNKPPENLELDQPVLDDNFEGYPLSPDTAVTGESKM